MEEVEEEEEDKKVVYGESFFNRIAGEVLDGGGASQGKKDEECKGEGGGDPEDSGKDGGALR